MKVLVIGSKGFIGEHLVTYLESKNYIVFGADVVVDYASKENYFLIDSSNSNFNFIFETETFDYCINCSGAASVPDSLNNPLRDFILNTFNVFNILSAIKKFQSECKFVNLSSAAVYGNPSILPIKENHKLQALSPYGYHKLQAETICEEFYRFFNLKTCSLRIFSAYGEGLKKQLFWDLFQKTKSKEPIVLFGTGNESRDFIYIKDLLVSIELSMLKSSFNAEVINIANGEEIYIKDVVEIFYSFFDRNPKYTFAGQERTGDPSNWCADISKLESFGYKKSVSIEVGLNEYYNWIQKL